VCGNMKTQFEGIAEIESDEDSKSPRDSTDE
jgi:hypothetical protein